MIVVSNATGRMAVKGVQIRRFAAIGFAQPIDGITVQSEGNGFPRAHCVLEMQRRRVIMIVVGAPAMAAPFVEFSNFRSNLAPVILRVKNWNPIGCKSDGSAQKASLDARWRGGWYRKKRNAPGVRAGVTLGNWDVLLPVRNAGHHRMGWQSTAFNVKKALVPTHSNLGSKRFENGSLIGSVALFAPR